jgi:hypothetical protein
MELQLWKGSKIQIHLNDLAGRWSRRCCSNQPVLLSKIIPILTNLTFAENLVEAKKRKKDGE